MQLTASISGDPRPLSLSVLFSSLTASAQPSDRLGTAQTHSHKKPPKIKIENNTKKEAAAALEQLKFQHNTRARRVLSIGWWPLQNNGIKMTHIHSCVLIETELISKATCCRFPVSFLPHRAYIKSHCNLRFLSYFLSLPSSGRGGHASVKPAQLIAPSIMAIAPSSSGTRFTL